MALAGWGIPKSAPVPKAFGPASPHPLLPQECSLGWRMLGSQLQSRVLATLAMREEGEMEGGRRSWTGQWGRDQIASSCPRHRCHWGQELLCFSALPAPPWHAPPLGLIVEWGQAAQLGLWGLNSPLPKIPLGHLLLGLAFGLGGLGFPTWEMERLA